MLQLSQGFFLGIWTNLK